MFIHSFIIIIISTALIAINFNLAKKETNEREKPSPFECGFDPICSSRIPLSLQFFLLAVIFLIFDIEITLILPASISPISSSIIPFSMMFSFLLIILIMGLILEWKNKALDWFT